jgi:ketosteroid isomerase-like protein
MTGEADVIDVLNREISAVEAGDITAYLSILSEDAVFLPPNGHPKRGAALRSWLGEFLDQYKIEWVTVDHEETVVVTDLAYHVFRYSWRVTPIAGGTTMLTSGKGLHILRRFSPGGWKVTREIWNLSPEAPETK